jgi:threonine/homoserine/homoserine lactone efflux protein
MVELLPVALVITVSPLSIIPAVLVLHAPQPRSSSLAYLAGWLLGLSILTAISIGISSMLGGLRSSPPHWASWLRIAVGTALVVFGVIRWLTRRGHDHIPAWMRTLTNVTPARAGITGAALTVLNPKVLFVCAAAGLAIGTDALGVAGTVASAALFVAVAGSSVAIPILAYVGAGTRLDGPLERLKNWMEKHNAGLVAAILVLIGFVLLYKGIHALWPANPRQA